VIHIGIINNYKAVMAVGKHPYVKIAICSR